jgi:Lysylphosphatidylglycerol synthase TM region
MSRFLSALAAVAVTALCLWFLLTPEIVGALARLAAEARPLPIVAAFALCALVQWLRAWRFAVMTTASLALPGVTMVRIAFQLNFLNFTLPFRLGELGYPVLMYRHYGCDLLHSTGVLLLARLFDLATVGAILLGAAALLEPSGGLLRTALALGALGLALAPFVMAFAGHALRPLLQRLPPRIGDMGARLTAGLDAIGRRRVGPAVAALGFAVWLVFGLAAILVAQAVVGTVSPAAAMLGAAAGNVAFALPVNGIAGIGPAQAAWVAATTQVGVPWGDAVVSALALHAVVLTNALVFGAIATLAGPGRRSRATHSKQRF